MRFIDRNVGVPLCFLFGHFDRLLGLIRRRRSVHPLEKILVVAPPAIGDAVLLLPSLRSIREGFPEAEIHLVAYPVNEEIFENCSYFDQQLVFNNQEYLQEPLKVFRFLHTLRESKYDLAIDFGQWLRTSALITFLSRAPRRIGFRTVGQHRHWVFTETVTHKNDLHEMECFLELVRVLGLSGEATPPRLSYDASHVHFAKNLSGQLKKRSKLLVGVHPGGALQGSLRLWDTDKFALVCDRLIETYEAAVILTGDCDDRRFTHSVISKMKCPALDVAGKTSLKQLAALIAECDVYICGNTGAMHIAAAVGTPIVALHGPSDSRKWGPVGSDHVIVRKDLSCVPCTSLGWEYRCTSGRCMEMITPDDVFQAATQLLQL